MGDKKMRRFGWLVFTIALLYLVAFGIASYLKGGGFEENRIAVIEIHGAIITEDASSKFFGTPKVTSDSVKQQLKKAQEDDSIKGILVDINSPGGTVVASKEIADALKRVNKTKIAVIREIGTSGAYWIAASADSIVANPLSITGSVGVSSSYLQFSKLFEKYGVGYERLVAGKYKDTGTPFRELTPEERELLEKKMKIVHEEFLEDVKKQRGLSESVVDEIAEGEFYLGREAKELGLVDYLGDREFAVELMKEELNISMPKLVKFKKKESLLSMLAKMSSYYFGKGIASELSVGMKAEDGISVNA